MHGMIKGYPIPAVKELIYVAVYANGLRISTWYDSLDLGGWPINNKLWFCTLQVGKDVK
jgi:hypothetical protein